MERVDYDSMVIQDLRNLHRRHELDLNPWYQRRSVWTRPQKAYLINSLHEQQPVPTIYIRHSLDLDHEKSLREVVDGQQRIRAILEYLDGAFPARHPAHSKRISFSELTKPQRSTFLMTSMSVGYLIAASDADVIEVFGRLNSVSKTLNAQEKRNADFSGEFKQFCLRQAAQRIGMWRSLRLFSANSIARMLEVQFISDLVMNMLLGLTDYSARRLRGIYAAYDEEFPQAQEIADRLERVFRCIASLNQRTITDTIFRRQPLFFSLLLVLDAAAALPHRRQLESALHGIDDMFNAEIPPSDRPDRDNEFIAACLASTQRIKTRKTRDDYIRQALRV